MTKIKDLIATLKTRNPEAQVFMMTTRKQPCENYLAGVVGREDMFDQKFRREPGVAADDVFLVVGKRIRPGSAWNVCDHHDTIVHPGVDLAPGNEEELMRQQASAGAQCVPMASDGGSGQFLTAGPQPLNEEEQNALDIYLEHALREPDSEMLMNVINALRPGPRQQQSWTWIFAYVSRAT